KGRQKSRNLTGKLDFWSKGRPKEVLPPKTDNALINYSASIKGNSPTNGQHPTKRQRLNQGQLPTIAKQKRAVPRQRSNVPV
ncbi:MAG: hypothetical protein RR420_08210, partial [Anaerovoracaceae bacterium]